MTDKHNGEEIPIEIVDEDESKSTGRLESEASRAVEEIERGVTDILAWLLDTETRSRIYIYLRKHPDSTSEEVAEGTGLYPSTVRAALAELHEEGSVTRTKREASGAGSNPFEYQAIPPSDLVSGAVDQLQEQLNAVFNLDRTIEADEPTTEDEPITITVDEEPDDTDDESRDE